MEVISLSCSNCGAKYKVKVHGELAEKLSIDCKKCGARIEYSPEREAKAPEPEPQPEIVQTTCEKCGSSFFKSVEDDKALCYQCRIEALVAKKKEEMAKQKELEPELQKAKSLYTFRNPDGLVLGPIKLKTALVLIREKRLRGDEEVSKDGGQFLPLLEYPELAELFPNLIEKQKARERESGEATEELEIPLDELEEETAKPRVETKTPSEPEPSSQVNAEPLKEVEEKRFRIYTHNESIGWLKKSTVLDLIQAGFLSLDDMVEEEGRKSRLRFKEHKEFSSLFPAKAEDEEAGEIVDLTETVEE